MRVLSMNQIPKFDNFGSYLLDDYHPYLSFFDDRMYVGSAKRLSPNCGISVLIQPSSNFAKGLIFLAQVRYGHKKTLDTKNI